MKTPWTIPRSSLATQRLPNKMVEVLEKTTKFLQEKCTRRVLNRDRMQIRGVVPATRTPQLDSIMKPEDSSTTKATDKQLANTGFIGTPRLRCWKPTIRVTQKMWSGSLAPLDYVAGSPP